jgi:RimJ/RimL family protein N-acetyltransferase
LIRALTSADREAALAAINEAARWYREFLPPGEHHEPEMTEAAWDAEARRLTWYGAFERGTLVGVMGLEYVRDVALLRHAYILPGRQRQGVGSRLLAHLETEVRGVHRIVVGTYQGNYKARSALEKAGYRASADPAAVLRAYYAIPGDRLRASLTYEKLLPKEAGAMANEAKVGTVTDYYAKIGVAAVRLTDGPLAVGDTIRIHGHTTDLTQPVDSLQLEHRAVSRAEPGTEVALKVRERVRKQDEVFRVTP